MQLRCLCLLMSGYMFYFIIFRQTTTKLFTYSKSTLCSKVSSKAMLHTAAACSISISTQQTKEEMKSAEERQSIIATKECISNMRLNFFQKEKVVLGLMALLSLSCSYLHNLQYFTSHNPNYFVKKACHNIFE